MAVDLWQQWQLGEPLMNQFRLAAPSALILWFAVANLAMAVSPPAYKATLLHPLDFGTSQGHDTDGTTQVGEGGGGVVDGEFHAMLWHGTPESVVDLNPLGFVRSVALGVAGDSQVGYATVTGLPDTERAMLWYGTAASAENLHPVGYDLSWATDANLAGYQVGFGRVAHTFNIDHALLLGRLGSERDRSQSGRVRKVACQ